MMTIKHNQLDGNSYRRCSKVSHIDRCEESQTSPTPPHRNNSVWSSCSLSSRIEMSLEDSDEYKDNKKHINTCNHFNRSISKPPNLLVPPRSMKRSSIACVSLLLLPITESFTVSPESFTNLSENKRLKCHGAACTRNIHNRQKNSSSAKENIKSRTPTSSTKQYDKGGDSFTVLMAKASHEQEFEIEESGNTIQNDGNKSNNDIDVNLADESFTLERRHFLHALVTATATTTISTSSTEVNAFDKAFPLELEFPNDDTSVNIETIRSAKIKMKKAKISRSKSRSQYSIFRDPIDATGGAVWGAALWFLLGSRSNPLVTPLANLLYDDQDEKNWWIKDRNEGMFSSLPLKFMVLLGILFWGMGIAVDRGVLWISEGNDGAVLQLAVISLISGGALELGRIANGEKKVNRQDNERELQLQNEFFEFASKRLLVGTGGNIHRSEVIKSFRKYFAKYRVENDQYPLGDLEIEGLLKTWNRKSANKGNSVSPAGFLKGVKVNSLTELK